jgi:hypothetical protein
MEHLTMWLSTPKVACLDVVVNSPSEIAVIPHSTESSFSGAYNYGSAGEYIVFKGCNR